MDREHLEHIIRAAADITQHYEFVVLGSQAVLGTDPNPPAVFTVSMEADIYPKAAPELADWIEGSIGEFSDFHLTYGYYAEGVDPSIAILPADWECRLNRVQNANTNGFVGYCLDVLDLFLAKAVAGRDKDRHFCTELLRHGYVGVEAALQKIPLMGLDARENTSVDARMLAARIRRWAANA